jgi:hypothetical protein
MNRWKGERRKRETKLNAIQEKNLQALYARVLLIKYPCPPPLEKK